MPQEGPSGDQVSRYFEHAIIIVLEVFPVSGKEMKMQKLTVEIPED
ncbi:hypothetical protein HKBW3S06_01608, partial [Candidatus Hakubella thermalkaliphila]